MSFVMPTVIDFKLKFYWIKTHAHLKTYVSIIKRLNDEIICIVGMTKLDDK